MNSVVGRRAFVRNMAVGLPVLAGTASIPCLARGTTISRASLLVTPTADPRIDLVLRQMAGLHNDMLRRGPTAEDARAAASHLRTLVRYHQESGRDAEVSMAFRELIAEKGVRAISTLQPDFTHMRSALKSYGIDARAVRLRRPHVRRTSGGPRDARQSRRLSFLCPGRERSRPSDR